jgi:ubiquitin-like-conjugating enzyme ATG3
VTGIVGSMQGTLKESKFLEKGILTPEEFVMAGEHLTHKCPTWR